MIFHILEESFVLVGLFLIPLLMISILTWFSYSYMDNNVGMFYNDETGSEGFTKWLEENSGETMCITFIVLYVFVCIFVLANKYIYEKYQKDHPDKIKVDVLSTQEIKTDLKLYSFKLMILYYYLGLLISSIIIIIAAFFSDQTSKSYQNIFCNPYYKK